LSTEKIDEVKSIPDVEPIEISLAGTNTELKLRFRESFLLQKEVGKTIPFIMERVAELDVEVITMIIRTCARWQYPNKTLDEISEMIDENDFVKVAEIIGNLFKKAYPSMFQAVEEIEKEDNSKNAKMRRGTGK
jgi:hypothetical protein